MAAVRKERSLRITHDPADRNFARQQAANCREPEYCVARSNLGEAMLRDVPHSAKRCIPTEPVDIEEQRSARIGEVGREGITASQPMDEVRVDRGEYSLARIEAACHVAVMLHQPLQFRGREVAVYPQAGPGADQVITAPVALFGAQRVAAPALPDDCSAQWNAGLAIDHYERFSLVRDADADDARASRLLPGQKFSGGLQQCMPDLVGVMLYPACLRIVLIVWTACLVDDIAGLVKEHDLGGRSALIDGQNVFHDARRSRDADFISLIAVAARPSIEIP